MEAGWLSRRVARRGIKKGRPSYIYCWNKGTEEYVIGAVLNLFPVAERGSVILDVLKWQASGNRLFSYNELDVLIELIKRGTTFGYASGLSIGKDLNLSTNTVKKALGSLTTQNVISKVSRPAVAKVFKKRTTLYILQLNHPCFSYSKPRIVSYELLDRCITRDNESSEAVKLYLQARDFRKVVFNYGEFSSRNKKLKKSKQRSIKQRAAYNRRLAKQRFKISIFEIEKEFFRLTSVRMRIQYIVSIFGDFGFVEYLQVFLHYYASILLTVAWDGLEVSGEFKQFIANDLSKEYINSIALKHGGSKKNVSLFDDVCIVIANMALSIAQRIKSFLSQAEGREAGAFYFIHPIGNLKGYNLDLKVTAMMYCNHPAPLSSLRISICRSGLDQYEVHKSRVIHLSKRP
jgi:predicted transcriptional regulator